MVFEDYLKKSGEVGYVVEVVHFIAYATGIPSAKMGEIIVFEDGGLGRVFGLREDSVEILLLSGITVKVGTRLTATGSLLEVGLSADILGKVVGPLGYAGAAVERRFVDSPGPGILQRTTINTSFETGTAIVDLVLPMGKGQRELVIGDRKTGKAAFLRHTLLNQARAGTVCIYAAIGKKQIEIRKLEEYIRAKGIDHNVCVVATSSSDSPGLIYMTPYTAMTIAEFFRDQGRDVFIILDDLTAHAKYYREITLLAKRFPGRNSYPGDIFYIHSRLLERAGNFGRASITCIPVAESVLGDLSGYIQTNLMSMTDGHIFFDTELSSLGRRPAINPFVSVTRVGRQTQKDLLKDLNRQVSAFMYSINKLKEFLHFGAELSETVRQTLAMGDRLTAFFDQPNGSLVHTNMGATLVAFIWAGYWKQSQPEVVKVQMYKMNDKYLADPNYKADIDRLVGSAVAFKDLVDKVKERGDLLAS